MPIGPRVLILSGEAEIRRTLVARLARDGFRADGCASAVEARSRMGSDLALLLIGLELPDVDAIDFVRRVSKTRPALPVVGLSAHANDERVIAAIRGGARGCLFVDDPPDRLVAAVREALVGGRPMSRGMGALMLEHVRRSSRLSSQHRKAVCLLTTRERAVLDQLARGLVYEDVGRILGVSVNTVRSFVRTIYEKLDVNSRTEAVLVGVRLGLIKRTPYPGSVPR